MLGTIEMRAIPHSQTWLHDYPGLTLAAMSIHHLDAFRFLFGDPEFVVASARTDPRTKFPHRRGIVLYILEYANGLRASKWDDVWAGPAREGAAADNYIKRRAGATDGIAQGPISWPGYPNAVPRTIRFVTKRQPGIWFAPVWPEVWFPDAFQGGSPHSMLYRHPIPFMSDFGRSLLARISDDCASARAIYCDGWPSNV